MRLRELRLKKGLSMQRLAELSDLSCATIWLIEQGRLSPTLRTLKKLARALHVDVEELVREGEHGEVTCESAR